MTKTAATAKIPRQYIMSGSKLAPVLLFTVVILVVFESSSSAFLVVPHRANKTLVRISSSSSSSLGMGLYNEDDPVPRFVPDSSNNKKKNSDNDDEYLKSVFRLFDMQVDGREARDLLPRLSRTLVSGVECYFEESDAKVQTLAKRTACHPMDAAWALEACKGDVTEAWLCITTARRVLLNEQQQQDDDDDEDSLDAQLLQVLQQNKEMVEEEEEAEDYDERKNRIAKEQREQARRQAVQDAFRGGEPDQEWLPTKNPKPVDDEPWFTG